MLNKKVFLDESNISKNSSDENTFLIASVCVFEDLEIFKEAELILKKHGIHSEIKGSLLMTREYSNLRKELTEKIFPKLNARFFIYDFFIQKLLDFTSNYILDFPQGNQEYTSEVIFFLNYRHKLISFLSNKFKHEYSNNNWNIDYYGLINKAILEVKKINTDENSIFLLMLLFLKENFTQNKIEEIDNDNYQVLLFVIENISEDSKKIKYKIIIDDFLDKKSNEKVEFKKKVSDIFTIKDKTNPKIIFEKNKNNIGLQIADWCVSISRKTIKNLIEDFWTEVLKNEKETIIFTKDKEIWGNELLKILRSLFSNKSIYFSYNLQLTFELMAFLSTLIEENIDIKEILNINFLKNIRKKALLF